MFNELLTGYHDEAFVYIIGGQSGTYVSYDTAGEQTNVISVGGIYDWNICSGYVKDIRKAKSFEELPQETLDLSKPKTKGLTRKPIPPKQ